MKTACSPTFLRWLGAMSSLQELLVRIGLQLDQVRRSDDLLDFSEVDSFSVLAMAGRDRAPAAARPTASTADPTALVVIDYKTGSPDDYKNLGRRRSGARRHAFLQLPVYAYAARAAFGAPDHDPSRRGTGSSGGATTDRSATRSTPASTTRSARSSVRSSTASKPGVFSPNPPQPGPRSVRGVPLLRPRRPRHRRPLARGNVDDAARARRLPRRVLGPRTRSVVTARQLDAVRRQPATQPARDAIRTELDETLFVEAGAGTGQDRGARRSHRRARHRRRPRPSGPDARRSPRSRSPRRRRPSCATGCGASSTHAPTIADASDDGAGALRAGARRARRRRDLHAARVRASASSPTSRSRPGLPPRIEVHDEVSSLLAFERPLARLRRRPARRPRARGRGARHARGRASASSTCGGSPRSSTTTGTCSTGSARRRRCPALDVDAVARRARRGLRVRRRLPSRRRQDARAARRARASTATALRTAVDDVERVRAAASPTSRRSGSATRARRNWPDVDDAARPHSPARRAARRASSATVIDAALARGRRLPRGAHRRARRGAPARRRAGVPRPAGARACAAARSRARARTCARRLRDRYQRCSSTSSRTPTRSRSRSRRCSPLADDPRTRRDCGVEAAVEPGRLFFVGDPKQSIYRFRRADIATFLAARDHFAEPSRCSSRRNFRSTPAVLAWINHVFGELIQPEPRVAARVPRARAARAGATPTRTRRHAARRRAARRPARPPTSCARREAADVAARGARRDRRALAGRTTATPSEWRDARLGDICILLAGAHVARTSSSARSTTRGIPYRAETSSLVYGTPRGARPARRRCARSTIPSDELALVTALRSPLFGCGDDDLFEYHAEHDGRLGHPRRAARVAAGRSSGRRRDAVSSRELHDDTRVVDAERAARTHRARTARARARRRRRPVPRRRAAGPLRRRPGARVRRRGRRHAARLPRVGDAAGHRRGAGRRDGAARDRRRRGADHDDPRRQGPRVPDRRSARA